MRREPNIELYANNNKKGILLSLPLYQIIKSTIIKSIKKSPEKALPLHELIDNVTKKIPSRVEPWLVLQVKIDLYERGLIRQYFNRDRMQVIEMVRSR